MFLFRIKYFTLTYVFLVSCSWLRLILFLILLRRDITLMNLWTIFAPLLGGLLIASWFSIFRTVDWIDSGIRSKFIPCGCIIEYFFLSLGSQSWRSISWRNNRVNLEVPVRWRSFLKDLTFPYISHFTKRLFYFDSTFLILNLRLWIFEWGILYLWSKTLYKFFHRFSCSLLLIIYKFQIIFSIL
jgi:hypothetical protein